MSSINLKNQKIKIMLATTRVSFKGYKVPKQDEDTGNLQILLHLRSLF